MRRVLPGRGMCDNNHDTSRRSVLHATPDHGSGARSACDASGDFLSHLAVARCSMGSSDTYHFSSRKSWASATNKSLMVKLQWP